MTRGESCHTCRFWLPADDSAVNKDARRGFGWCRRQPPQIVDHMARMSIPQIGFGGNHADPEDIAGPIEVQRACLHPATHDDAWCGEFQHLNGEPPLC